MIALLRCVARAGGPGLASLLLVTACGAPDDDDSGRDPVDDDDDATEDELDDDDSAGPSSCGWALQDACADLVLEAPGASEAPFRDPTMAVNGVRGAGATSGGFDVFSLDDGEGATLTLGWSGRRVLDAAGPDLIVFENPFESGGPGQGFLDPAVVEVSEGSIWVAFPHAFAGGTTYSPAMDDWAGFAGIHPVLLHEEDNPVPPFGGEAGGDAFDLADLPGPEGEAVRAAGVVALRITSASALEDPATGAPYPHDPVANGSDIDGVYARLLSAE